MMEEGSRVTACVLLLMFVSMVTADSPAAGKWCHGLFFGVGDQFATGNWM